MTDEERDIDEWLRSVTTRMAFVTAIIVMLWALLTLLTRLYP